MSGAQSIISGMAGRYASALFDLALEAGKLDGVAKDLRRFANLLDGSADLHRLVVSPVFTAEQQTKAVQGILTKAKITGMAANFIALTAKNRRLFAVSDMMTGYHQRVAAHKGELTAEVTSAIKLTAAQTTALKTALKKSMGKDVQVLPQVDENLLGGLIVKVGSRQIDTSLRTKLNNLSFAMKEAG